MNDNLVKLEEKGMELWAWGHLHTFAAGLIIGAVAGVIFSAIFL